MSATYSLSIECFLSWNFLSFQTDLLKNNSYQLIVQQGIVQGGIYESR